MTKEEKLKKIIVLKDQHIEILNEQIISYNIIKMEPGCEIMRTVLFSVRIAMLRAELMKLISQPTITKL